MAGNKILHRVFGEEFFELTAQLRGKCFVMGESKLVSLGDTGPAEKEEYPESEVNPKV